jgi:hypothetical protein
LTPIEMKAAKVAEVLVRGHPESRPHPALLLQVRGPIRTYPQEAQRRMTYLFNTNSVVRLNLSVSF